jgi:hypothetical protein
VRSFGLRQGTTADGSRINVASDLCTSSARYPPSLSFVVLPIPFHILHMRTIAFVVALTALVAPASAFLWGCYPASANSGTLAYTDAVGNSPNKCSNACITAHHGPAVIVSGADVSWTVLRTSQVLTVDVIVLLRVLPADGLAGQQRVRHALPGLSLPGVRRSGWNHQCLHQRLI